MPSRSAIAIATAVRVAFVSARARMFHAPWETYESPIWTHFALASTYAVCVCWHM